ncbi:MAG: DUF554 domain-containing protein [Bacillota bacterium]|nr:DUF554 domain-containing protein [Bacillota bacterium]
MIATIVNCLTVIICGLLGTVFKKYINDKYTTAILTGLSIVVAVIGMGYALKTENTLCMIICMVAGIFLGEALRIEDRLEGLGEIIKNKLIPEQHRDSTFVQSFVSGSLLFCIGSMAIVGSMEAGINGDISIILSKSVIDGIAALSFAISLGVGVVFAGFSVLLYQGALTLLAVQVAPFLAEAVVTEMSAVGGVLMIGIAVNMMGLAKIKVGNMLPCIFLPLLYMPLSNWLTSLF